jgi:hypothetical protein
MQQQHAGDPPSGRASLHGGASIGVRNEPGI